MQRYATYVVAFLLAACGGETFQDKSYVPPDAPAYIKGTTKYPGVKIGKPYTIAGKRYYPAYDPDYDEVGLASWYGPNFHGKSTANGERYNQWAMTAAHKTLPLPSIVKVTRLDNGQSIIVRINDRGPFADGRIIDLSRAAAEALGTRKAGLAKVRVQYLPEETERFMTKAGLSKPEVFRRSSATQAPKEVEYLSFDAPEPVSPIPAPEPVQTIAENRYIETDSLPPLGETTIPEPLAELQPNKKQELGYVEDAFSVLDQIDAKHAPEPLKVNPRDPEIVQNLQRVKRLDTPLFVQVASFSDKANALTLAERLSNISAVEVYEVDVKGVDWYRVRLGPTQNHAIAQELKERVAEWGIRDARIIQDSPR